MSRPVTYRELCTKAYALGWRVKLITAGNPPRLSSLRVSDRDDEEIAYVYIHPKHSLDMAAAHLVEEMEKSSA